MSDKEKSENTIQEIENPEQVEVASTDTPNTAEANAEPADDAAAKARERLERFKALKSRAKTANKQNLNETVAETKRMATDPTLAKSLDRKVAFASHKVLKADTEAAGEDFERKRAWDWTVEESERWDKRMERKKRHRDNVAFQNYDQDAQKVYKRQMRQNGPDLEAYEKEKLAAIEKAAANGDLEIVETEDGEMIAIDKNGSFYSTADSVGFTDSKPDRAAVDRLVGDLQKAEDERLRKRKARRGDEEADVTYINEKNKHFNQKLARFYNKYTTEIRDSFERGTMI